MNFTWTNAGLGHDLFVYSNYPSPNQYCEIDIDFSPPLNTYGYIWLIFWSYTPDCVD